MDIFDKTVNYFKDDDIHNLLKLKKRLQNMNFQNTFIFHLSPLELNLIRFPVYSKVLQFVNFHFKFLQDFTPKNEFIIQTIFSRNKHIKEKIIISLENEIKVISSFYDKIKAYKYYIIIFVILLFIFLILYKKKSKS